MYYQRWIGSILLVSTIASAKTEVSCIKDLVYKLHTTEEILTTNIVTCSIKILEGDKYLMYWDAKTWARLYPESLQTQFDQANRLNDLTVCQQITATYNKYMRDCTKN